MCNIIQNVVSIVIDLCSLIYSSCYYLYCIVNEIRPSIIYLYRYNIYVHCTSSAYFIIDDLLHFVLSHGLHFVCTEILTCCKICTHKMATEKCFLVNDCVPF